MREAYASYVEKKGKTFTIECKANEIEESFMEEDGSKPKKIDREYAVDPDHPNALVVNCVQVSTFYNKNDHYFIPAELWKAKETSKCMIADWEHDREQIIGCISDTYAVDQEGNVLDNSFEIAEDTSFDIYNEVVVWEKQFPEHAEKIRAMYEEGALFVSMECTFEDFNFALQKDGEEEAIMVERNEDTDFLTDSLLIFGGSGAYKNYRVGIAFEGISFVGVGFVARPANERSHVLDVAGKDVTVADTTLEDVLKESKSEEIDMEKLIEANILKLDSSKDEDNKDDEEDKKEKNKKNKEKYEEEEKSGVKNDIEKIDSANCVAHEVNKGDKSMDFEKAYAEASEKLEKATEEVVILKAELENAAEVRIYSRKDSGEDEYSYKTTDYDGNEVKVTEKTVYSSDSVTTVTEELVAKIADLSAQKEEIAGQLKEASEKLGEIETARKQEARKSAVAEKDVEIEDEELFAMSDESFDTMIKFAPAKKEEVAEDVVEEEVVEKTDEEKEEAKVKDATEEVEEIEKDEQNEEIAGEQTKEKEFVVVASMLREIQK